MPNTIIKTFSGKYIDLLNPKVEDFCIEDIAHSLANQGRWTGHTSKFYSVAQHSVVASFMIELGYLDTWYKVALLHDAGEAYYGDLATPFKIAMGEGYQRVKQPIDKQLYKAFRCVFSQKSYEKIIKPVDSCLLSLEAEWLMRGSKLPNPLPAWSRERLGRLMERCWGPVEAEERFWDRWKELNG